MLLAQVSSHFERNQLRRKKNEIKGETAYGIYQDGTDEFEGDKDLLLFANIFEIMLVLTSFSLKYSKMLFWYSTTSKNLSRSFLGRELSKSVCVLSIDITDIGDTTPLTDIGVSERSSCLTTISRRGSLKRKNEWVLRLKCYKYFFFTFGF